MAKTARFVQEGKIIDVIATADTNGGDFIDFGSRVGVASTGVLAGESVALQVEGVFEVAAVDADTVSLGAKLYVDATGVLATTDATSGRVIGYATTEKAGAVAGTVLVKLGA